MSRHFGFRDVKEKTFDHEHHLLDKSVGESFRRMALEEERRKKLEENEKLFQPWHPEEHKAPEFIPRHPEENQ